MKDIPLFDGWSSIPYGYCTKTQLKTILGRKPSNPDEPDARVKFKLREYNLYFIENTELIKARVFDELEQTTENIIDSLYVLNVAKVVRNINERYSDKNYRNESAAYIRRTLISFLQLLTIEKMRDEKMIHLKEHYFEVESNRKIEYATLVCSEFKVLLPVRDKNDKDLHNYADRLSFEFANDYTSFNVDRISAQALLLNFIGLTEKHIVKMEG